jgi:DNA-binding CsgD family transcriptional regulator
MNARTVQMALASVTPREREVLHWVCEGKTDAEIGEILGISVHTVSKHLQRVFAKFGVENRTAAARFISFAALREPSNGKANHPRSGSQNSRRNGRHGSHTDHRRNT